MNQFKEKVAVVTGAASGIGRAMAERCAQEGMKVILADIEDTALAQTEKELKSAGATVLAVQTDVSIEDSVKNLAQKALVAFDEVHLLFNNAGVGAGGTIWESTKADWEWVIGVNLWGIIYGIRTFVPLMLAQDNECYIVNTASAAGLLPYHPSAPYQVTKHAVVALSENLYFSLQANQAKIDVSVLCPAWVQTQIMDSERNRPLELQNQPAESSNPAQEAIFESLRQATQAGILPQKVVDCTFDAIRAKQFYVFTHPEYISRFRQRMEDILQQRNPASL